MNDKVNLRACCTIALAPKLLVTALPGSSTRRNNFWWQLYELYSACGGDEKAEEKLTLVIYGKDILECYDLRFSQRRVWCYLPVVIYRDQRNIEDRRKVSTSI